MIVSDTNSTGQKRLIIVVFPLAYWSMQSLLHQLLVFYEKKAAIVLSMTKDFSRVLSET